MKNYFLKKLPQKVVQITTGFVLLIAITSMGLNAQTYCTPSFPQGNQYPNGFGCIYNFSTANAVVDINNPTLQGPNGYQDFSDTHQAQVMQDSSFDIIVSVNTGSGCSVSVWIDWNNDGVFSADERVIAQMDVKGPPGNPTNLPAVETIYVPASQEAGTYRIRAMSQFGITTPPIDDPCYVGTNWLGDSEDYSVVVLSDAPSCPPVTSLVKSNETISSVDVAWTIGDSETSWDVRWGTENFDPETNNGTLVGNATTSVPNYSITDLTVDMNYQIFVRADCGGETSTWKSISYTPSYCSATSDWDDIGLNTQIASFYTTGGVDNISNMNSGISPNGYGNFTDMIVSSHAGGSINFVLNTNETYLAIGLWVDWNNNGIFDDEEQVYYDQENGSANATITVPLGQPLGDYRMRARVEFGPEVIDPGPPEVLAFYPCGEIVLGETEDYTFKVVPPPGCSPVTALNTSNVTSTSVTFSWTAGGTETLWNIEYGLTGFTQGSGISSVAVGTSNSLNGLTPNTSYDIYVQANCGSGNESTWEMTSFTTDVAFSCPDPLNAGTISVTPNTGVAGGIFDVTSTGYDTGDTITYTWEKSEDNGTTWIVIGTANSSTYTDLIGEVAPDSGVVEYRLTISCDGNTASATGTFTTTVNVANFDLFGFRYHPNPVNDILHFSSNSKIEKVIISNILGQQISANLNSDNTTLDMSNLPSGNYFVKVTIEGVSRTIKIIKN